MNNTEYQKRKQAENILDELIAVLEPKKEESSVAFKLRNQLGCMKMSVYTMPLKNVEAVIANREKNLNVANAC